MIRAVILYYVMATFIIFRDELALSADSGFMQHILYPLAHANLLHYAVNGFSLLFLSVYMTWQRTAWAYAFSILCGYLYIPSLPLLGCSTVIYYYLGMLFVHYNSWNRFHLLSVSFAALFIPGIAAMTHIIMMAFGILSEIVRLNYTRTSR